MGRPSVHHAQALTAVTARLSSTLDTNAGRTYCGAERCIDQDTTTTLNCRKGTSLCHSATQSAPWLELDLGADRLVGNVIVHNRRDCCRARLGRFEVCIARYV